MMQILDTGIHSAEENMQFDAKLLEQLEPNSNPILHLYQWARPSATFGYFSKPEKHLDLKKVAECHLDLARRPTGGGIVFHIWDLAFSFLMPARHPSFSLGTLDNYEFVNAVVLDAMKEFFSLDESIEMIIEDAKNLSSECGHFCMAKPTQYDVVYKGLKIAGAAQRKRKQGYLHQGTISLAFPHIDLLKDVLLSKTDVLEAMKSFTFAPLGRIWQPDLLKKTRIDLQKLLAHKLELALKFHP